MIPKILFQTSAGKPEESVLGKLKPFLSDQWQYLHFNDADIVQFFSDHYIKEFCDIEKKFHGMPTGAHKADLFRYYFLYVNGGVFVDSDAMLQTNIDLIVEGHEFFSVNSSYHPNSIFQGFIGCSKNNSIIFEALKDAYSTEVESLQNDYFLFTRNLYKIIKRYSNHPKIILFQEHVFNSETAKVTDDFGNILLLHFYKYKIIKDIDIDLSGDGIDYELLYKAAASIKGAKGIVCEIGSRRGGSIKQIIDGLLSVHDLNRNIVCLDPYGNIDYAYSEEGVRKFDYNNQMRNEFLPNLYRYVHAKPVNVVYYCLEDSEFYKRFHDGVPFYHNKKTIENQYALVFFDGPHNLKSLMHGVDFFMSKMPKGAFFVFDAINSYPHEKIEKKLMQSGFRLISYGYNSRKASYQKYI